MVDSDALSEKLARDLVQSSSTEVPDLILLATPIASIRSALESEKNTSVKLGFMDISSVKTKVKVDVTTSGLPTTNFLPTHPMAGQIGRAHV